MQRRVPPLLTVPLAYGAPPGGGDAADGFMPVFSVVVVALPAVVP